MPLQKVKPGDPLRIPAETFNSFIDAASDLRARQQSGVSDPGRSGPDQVAVRIRNESGADRDRFAVLVITGIVFSPTDNALAFKNQPVFKAAAPTSADDQKLVILQEPVKANAVGRAVLSGVSVVQLDVQADTDINAGPVANDTTKLKSGSAGLARILYKESGTGTKWAVVLFPVGGNTLATIKFDGTRGTSPANRCYTGHELKVDGTLGTSMVQFVFDNDPGVDTMPTNAIITAEEAPPRLANANIWQSASYKKYRGVSCAPYSILG